MWFSGAGGSSDFGAGVVVAAVGVDCECADYFAGCGVDDADVETGDEHDDAGSVEGSTESDVVHVACYAQADASDVYPVVTDSELAVGGIDVWAGFWSGGVGNGGCGPVIEGSVWPVVVVSVDEVVDVGLQRVGCGAISSWFVGTVPLCRRWLDG